MHTLALFGTAGTGAPGVYHGATARLVVLRTDLAALLDQAQPCPGMLHGAYYLKDRDSRS